MKPGDRMVAMLLAALAVLIWVRDLSWLEHAANTWPLLAGLPLFFGLTRPWSFPRQGAGPPDDCQIGGPLAIFLLGLALNLTTVLAAAWTWLFWGWVRVRLPESQRRDEARRLLLLPLLSFPWIATDFESVGWAFRLSGAAVAEHLFAALHWDVIRQGTYLWVEGQPISVEAACSGLNGLQALLLAGTVLAYFHLKASPWFWWNLPLLVAASWLANTLRITTLALFSAKVGLTHYPLAHDLAGWLALCLAFGLCWFIFSLQAPKVRTP